MYYSGSRLGVFVCKGVCMCSENFGTPQHDWWLALSVQCLVGGMNLCVCVYVFFCVLFPVLYFSLDPGGQEIDVTLMLGDW